MVCTEICVCPVEEIQCVSMQYPRISVREEARPPAEMRGRWYGGGGE
jgi:hypothetical protein